MNKYINPFTDFGFKMLFGQEANKDLLIDFLNDLFDGEKIVHELKYLNKEQTKRRKDDRTIIYDIYCTGDDGEHFIVEIQNKVAPTFKDRALYYMATDLVQQGISGDWDYTLLPVYGIFLLNSPLSDTHNKLRTDVILTDRDTHELFSDKLRMIFLELPFFNKNEAECISNFDKWIYVLKHMATLERLPFTKQKEIFGKLADVAELDKLEEPMRSEYKASLKAYRDTNTLIKDSEAKGMAKGMAKGRTIERIEMVRNVRRKGFDDAAIADLLGLSLDDVKDIN